MAANAMSPLRLAPTRVWRPLFVAAGVLVLAAGCSRPRPSGAHNVRLIVLGVDGMDPRFVQRHWSDLPNLDRLRRNGDFKPLATTTPPQSPVAWSTFITGMDPAGHGIYDFVRRDLTRYLPVSSMTRTQSPRHTLSLGPYLFPLSKSREISLRQGKAFWQILAEHDIPVTVIRMPTNYPPVPAGKAIAGMGTPDLLGTFGTFTFFTDDPEEISRHVDAGRIVKVDPMIENRAVLQLEGAWNPLRKDQRPSSVDLTVEVDPREPVAQVAVGDTRITMRQGEWSGWLRARFPLIPGLAGATGIFRLYAKQLHPRFELYVSPVNIDPDDPDLPISVPSGYSREVARATGPFYTQGIAEDTAALRQNVFGMSDYLTQSRLVFEDERKLLGYALSQFREGLLFVYFSSIDQDSHMLWGRHEAELLDTYRNVDAAIGETIDHAHGADLIVMSDHGFTSFDRAVNLNTWLWKNGYLGLDGVPGDESSPARVVWSRTKAYALGLQSIYLNLAGREKEGIVPPGTQSQDVLRKLQSDLLAFRDGEHPVVESVHAPPRSDIAPDLIVGYAPGYRVSWRSALAPRVQMLDGVMSFTVSAESLVEDNNQSWIGDHCINAAAVPGVLFSKKKIAVEAPQLKDITVSILAEFGIGPAPGMSGRKIL